MSTKKTKKALTTDHTVEMTFKTTYRFPLVTTQEVLDFIISLEDFDVLIGKLVIQKDYLEVTLKGNGIINNTCILKIPFTMNSKALYIILDTLYNELDDDIYDNIEDLYCALAECSPENFTKDNS